MKEVVEYFEYKGNEYLVLGEVKMKHPETREWVDAIRYHTEGVNLEFVREKKEFLKLFKRVS